MIGSWGLLRATVLRLHDRPATSAGDLALLMSIADTSAVTSAGGGGTDPAGDPRATRLRALVELACGGDAEAFGQLYDHYLPGVFRFVYYRVSSRTLAEDLTSETFTRALRSIGRYEWQGKDFGAWLTTIARNIVTDHYKSSRNRLEVVTEEAPETGPVQPGPEDEVLESLTNAVLMDAVRALPDEQRDCLLMRFVQDMTISQTAEALGRSEGAVKQLQLRAVRRLAREVPREAVT
ncbi:MAG: sigma-70 family RNA polymerase sigma factor [Nocardioidaceae bacterium]|nr:sigma-70 family RNA polymerase sigma factor [Nocardioidaceae bacterium]